MRTGLIAKKMGMTRIFADDGQPAQAILDILGFLTQIEQSRAATAAAWLNELGQVVVCDSNLAMAAINQAGPAPKPRRQPVIA